MPYAPSGAIPSGIPAIAGSTVVVAGPGPSLAAFRATDGKALWRRTLPGDPSESPGAPLVIGSRVFVVDGTTIVAVDLMTGSVQWQEAVSHLGEASAALLAINGLVLTPAEGLPVYDPVTGAVHDLLGQASGVRSVAVQQDVVLVVDGSGTLDAYTASGHPLWRAIPPPIRGPLGQAGTADFVGVEAGSGGIVVAMEGVRWPCLGSEGGDGCLDNGGLFATGLSLDSGRVLWSEAQGTNLGIAADAGDFVALEAGSGEALSLTHGTVEWCLPGDSTAGATVNYSSVGRVPAAFVAFDPGAGRLTEVDAANGTVEGSAVLPSPQDRGLDERPHLATLGSYVAVTTDTGELALFDLPAPGH